jgi:hypothetical protein
MFNGQKRPAATWPNVLSVTQAEVDAYKQIVHDVCQRNVDLIAASRLQLPTCAYTLQIADIVSARLCSLKHHLLKNAEMGFAYFYEVISFDALFSSPAWDMWSNSQLAMLFPSDYFYATLLPRDLSAGYGSAISIKFNENAHGGAAAAGTAHRRPFIEVSAKFPEHLYVLYRARAARNKRLADPIATSDTSPEKKQKL